MRISGAVTVEIAGISSEHTEVVGLKQVALVWLRGRYVNLPDGLSGFSSLTFLEELHLGEITSKYVGIVSVSADQYCAFKLLLHL